MHVVRRLLLIVTTISFVMSAAFAQEPKAKAQKAKAANPAFAPVQDVAGLPRVLVIGDSISIGYTIPLREALQGKANVHRPTAARRRAAFNRSINGSAMANGT